MAYKNGPLSSEFSDYLNTMPRAQKRLKEKNALQRKKRQMVPEPLYRHTEQESGGIRNRWSHENESITNSQNDEEYRGNVGEHAVRSAQRDAAEYKRRWEENQKEQKQRQEKLDSARQNARKNISGKLTPAQVRRRYINENGVDSEDSKKTRNQLNETAGHTIVKNLKENNGRPIIDYRIQQAEQRTKRNKKW